METVNYSFMDWVYLSYITSSLLFSSIFALIYYIHRNRYSKLWSASWAILASAYLLLYMPLAFNYSVLIPLYLLAIVSGSYMFYLASLDYMHCQGKTIWKILMGFAIILTAGMVYSENMLLYGSVVFSFFSGLLYFSSGIVFIRSKDNINRLVGSMIIILSLLILAYPLIEGLLWTIPWFYLINGMLGLIVALGTLGLHFRYQNQVLRNSEQELKTITNNMTDVVAMADVEGIFTYISESNYQLTGYIPGELLGKSIYELIHDEDLSTVGALFQEGILDGRKGARVEYRIRNKNGDHIWVETIGSLVLDNNGQPSGALLTTRDISERKKAVEELKISEDNLKTITDNMTDLVSKTDVEGKFVYLSESSHRFLGYEKSELIGRSVFELVHEEDLSVIVERFQRAIATGKNDRVEYRIKKKDGSYNWVETIGNFISEDDKVIGAVFTVRDISDRKQAEEALKESEQKHREILEAMEEGYYEVDLAGNIVFCNDSFCKMTGYSFDELMGESYKIFYKNPQAVFQATNLVYKTGKSITAIDWPAITKDGRKFHLEISISLRHDEKGQPIGFRGVVRDITDRKQAEEKIRYMSFHDQLTDLYNRHYFEKCKEELKDIPLVSVIMTDLNGLKLVNDTYGHEAGDELLKKYAELLKNSFKESDLFFRWGGDEFIVILKNIGEAKSWELCNRLIKHCGKTFVQDIPLSVSVGISSKFEGVDIDKAIREAEDMMYKNKLIESKSNKYNIMKTLLKTLSEKSFETKGHIDRMTLVGKKFGEKLSLSPSELSRLETLTMLHDIGKINMSEKVLKKTGALTKSEWKQIKKHPVVGYRITRTAEEFACVAEDILAHHERWDGKGYPQGLKGESIPYLARLLNIIDSYDVMGNGRPYKNKMSLEEIIEEVERCSGKQFDPGLAEVFIDCLKDGYFDSSNDEWKINK